jgi:hypothetical protein
MGESDMNQNEIFTLDDRPFKRDLETGEILKDPNTGNLIRMSKEEYDAYLSDHRRKIKFEARLQAS